MYVNKQRQDKYSEQYCNYKKYQWIHLLRKSKFCKVPVWYGVHTVQYSMYVLYSIYVVINNVSIKNILCKQFNTEKFRIKNVGINIKQNKTMSE